MVGHILHTLPFAVRVFHGGFVLLRRAVIPAERVADEFVYLVVGSAVQLRYILTARALPGFVVEQGFVAGKAPARILRGRGGRIVLRGIVAVKHTHTVVARETPAFGAFGSGIPVAVKHFARAGAVHIPVHIHDGFYVGDGFVLDYILFFVRQLVYGLYVGGVVDERGAEGAFQLLTRNRAVVHIRAHGAVSVLRPARIFVGRSYLSQLARPARGDYLVQVEHTHYDKRRKSRRHKSQYDHAENIHEFGHDKRKSQQRKERAARGVRAEVAVGNIAAPAVVSVAVRGGKVAHHNHNGERAQIERGHAEGNFHLYAEYLQNRNHKKRNGNTVGGKSENSQEEISVNVIPRRSESAE